MNTDAILIAAREACKSTDWPALPDPGPKNAENIALLIGLLDSAKIIAQAIYDNAMDDRRPIDPKLATELQIKSWNIARVIVESSQILEVMPPV